MIEHPTTYRELGDNGHWYEVHCADELISRCRLTEEHDETASERFPYDPACALCWLGNGHSGAYHRWELRSGQCT